MATKALIYLQSIGMSFDAKYFMMEKIEFLRRSNNYLLDYNQIQPKINLEWTTGRC